MKKYRIIEEGKKFYAQEKKTILSPWMFLDNYFASKTWIFDKYECQCSSIESAIEVIEKRITFKEKPKKVIHKYPLTTNIKGGNQ
jgi:hypothetical protein